MRLETRTTWEAAGIRQTALVVGSASSPCGANARTQSQQARAFPFQPRCDVAARLRQHPCEPKRMHALVDVVAEVVGEKNHVAHAIKCPVGADNLLIQHQVTVWHVQQRRTVQRIVGTL